MKGDSRHEGRFARQAHVDLPDGSFEREIGRDGFFGEATHVYHRHPPTGWRAFEGPLRPRAFDVAALGSPASPWEAPVVLENGALAVSFWRLAQTMRRLVRNADGDLLAFVHHGSGDLYCDYGHLSFRAGDYVLLPRGTLFRLEIESLVEVLLIEARGGAFSLPDRGLVGRHAVFDPAVLEHPRIDDAFRAQQVDGEWSIDVRHRRQVSTVFYPYNPLDAIGWKGDVYPVRLAVGDIRPLASHRVHLPPSAHTTFVAPRFVVCTFAPRPFETDPAALKVPFFHSNDDYDEMIFYHAGDFFSRDGIAAGMLTFHPAGFTHGPHPKALERAFTQPKAMTDEIAVMIDARDPLDVGPAMAQVERADYAQSWQRK